MIGTGSIQCNHCREWFAIDHEHEHPGLCCDCFDLSWFPEEIEQLNRERADKGKRPLPPWTRK